jgi:hypothetical protein
MPTKLIPAAFTATAASNHCESIILGFGKRQTDEKDLPGRVLRRNVDASMQAGLRAFGQEFTTAALAA